MNNIPSELLGWDEIFDAASRHTSNATSLTKASQEQVLATVNLAQSIFNAQKHLSERLDKLNERLAESAKSADRLS